MFAKNLFLLSFSLLITTVLSDLPTNYEYYNHSSLLMGLSADSKGFYLNLRNITIYSGTMHYFRVPRAYWRDRLRKMRAAGLNTVETSIPWNLHEPVKDFYDFGNGGSDFQDFLHLEEFLKAAKEEDLFTIVRPGPFINAEIDFGGFPSWLMRAENITLRYTCTVYMNYVSNYFSTLIPILAKHQFIKGGSIIAFQVENEFGNIAGKNVLPEKNYLMELRDLMLQNGIEETLFTVDDSIKHGDVGTLSGLFLQTTIIEDDPEAQCEKLRKLQNDKPCLAMIFRSGGHDNWAQSHHFEINSLFSNKLEKTLKVPASINFYMFVGGTNYGFINGASNLENIGYLPVTTSFDYEAPITEAGNYTKKYTIIKDLLEKYNTVKTKIPKPPKAAPVNAYPSIKIESQIDFSVILHHLSVSKSNSTVPMELLPNINSYSGQSYGYIVYRKQNVLVTGNNILKIGGHVHDSVIVIVDGKTVNRQLKQSTDLNGFGYWRLNNSEICLASFETNTVTIQLVVENWGRADNTFKGLYEDDIYINDAPIKEWEIYPLEFRKSWTNSLIDWMPVYTNFGPNLYKATLQINDTPYDTYIDMQNWAKGIVIVNGFVLGRYARIGPQQALYLPAPLLSAGDNDIIVFEHFTGCNEIEFSKEQIYKLN